VRLKALQLRMMPIAPGLPAQHRASQQCFAPERNQALRIKVLRMDRPESHVTDVFQSISKAQRRDWCIGQGRRSKDWF